MLPNKCVILLYICCLFVYHLYILYIVSDDPNIDSQQVVYISLNFFLERMTNHFKIPNVFIMEYSGKLKRILCFSRIIFALSKELCGTFWNLGEISRIRKYINHKVNFSI